MISFFAEEKRGRPKERGVLGRGGAVIYFTYAAAASSVWAESPFNRLVYVGGFLPEDILRSLKTPTLSFE